MLKKVPVVFPSSTSKDYYEPEIILAVNVDETGLKEAMRLGLRLEQKINLKKLNLEITRFRTEPGIEVRDVLRELQKSKSKILFDINHYYELAVDKEKCNDIRCYPLKIMNWTTSEFKGRGIRIGIVDTAVDTQTPCMVDRHIFTSSFVDEHNSAGTEHGTAVASLLIGKPDSQFPGLMPEAILYAAGTFFIDQAGRVQTSAMLIARALDWLVAQDVSVINMSLSGPKNKVLKKSIAKVLQREKVVVAAAGNNGPQGSPAYPAASKGVIAITAVDRFQRPYSRANRGRYINFAAPGVGIWTPCIDGRGRFRSGTSYAAAYFTAMAAEQLNQPGMEQGHKALRKVSKKRALDLGPPGKDSIYGWGLVRCPFLSLQPE